MFKYKDESFGGFVGVKLRLWVEFSIRNFCVLRHLIVVCYRDFVECEFFRSGLKGG